jgi:hypothetical protein
MQASLDLRVASRGFDLAAWADPLQAAASYDDTAPINVTVVVGGPPSLTASMLKAAPAGCALLGAAGNGTAPATAAAGPSLRYACSLSAANGSSTVVFAASDGGARGGLGQLTCTWMGSGRGCRSGSDPALLCGPGARTCVLPVHALLALPSPHTHANTKPQRAALRRRCPCGP